MASVHPYLHFDGKTEEAFNFYRSVFGTEFRSIMRYKDIPEDVPGHPDSSEKILHVSLPIGDNTILMGSDRPDAFGKGLQGDSYRISIQADSEEETKRLFKELSAGGKVTMPLEKAFWGAVFGMFRDKFGVQWMVNFQNDNEQF